MTEEVNAPSHQVSREDELSARQEMKREIIEFVKMIAWFLVLFFIVKTYVVEGYEVQGPSMIPTLKDRERILVLKLPQTLSHVLSQVGFNRYAAMKPGDVVVFDSPVEPNKRYVKRVIAKGPAKTGGNTVAAEQADSGKSSRSNVSVCFDHGSVYVNNEKLDESFLSPEQRRLDDPSHTVSLAPGTYYVLGDNRIVSKDSRSFGPVDENRVIGRAFLCFWPPSKIRLIK